MMSNIKYILSPANLTNRILLLAILERFTCREFQVSSLRTRKKSCSFVSLSQAIIFDTITHCYCLLQSNDIGLLYVPLLFWNNAVRILDSVCTGS